MRICFFGSSIFGYSCLETALNCPEIEVAGVVTTISQFRISYSPDHPVTNVLHKDFQSIKFSHPTLPVFTMKKGMQDSELIRFINEIKPDLILVIGWYHMVPIIIRSIPPKGVVGIHASLLPKYRGGAPLVWAVINGEEEAGLSLFYFDDGVDTGDIIGQRYVPIKLNDSIASLYRRIEKEGLSLLDEMLPKLANGTAPRMPQKAEDEKVWPQRGPDDGKIDWRSSSISVYNFIRAQTKPYPGAYTFRKNEKLRIWKAKLYDFTDVKGYPGEVLGIANNHLAKGFIVGVNDGDVPLLVTEVGTELHESLPAHEYAIKEHLSDGEMLGGE
jgi:methionyl-tRNA formyltransferase